ncbi:MAG: gliding motility-associated C-terminal domain-containing protein [Bacteroidales bacterium]|nr:gliding motility-associated C-terminal domain-containing protein [Bacteroidales bacterium]MCF8456635.1 gliding motility-associated C-terminal domain-containing protein [Bacteroidales bacterium]
MKSIDNKFETIIKGKIDQFELPYDHTDWLAFEKMLPKVAPSASAFSTFGKIASLITAAAVVATLAIFYFQPQSNNTSISQNSETIQNIETQTPGSPQPENSITPATINDRSNASKVEEKTASNKISNKIETEQTRNATKIEVSPEAKDETTENNRKVKETVTIPVDLPNAEFQISTLSACALSGITFIPVEISKKRIYLWSFGDGSISTSASPVHSYKVAGRYTISLEVKDSKSGNSAQWEFPDQIIINPKPDASFTSTREVNKFSFNATSSDFVVNKWQITDKQFINMGLISYSFQKSGIYPILHICENQEACTDTVFQELQVEIEHPFLMPNAFSPNGDGYNDFFGPNSDCCADYQFKMFIFNSTGNLLFESNSPDDKWNGLISGYNKMAEPGVYVYKVITTDKYGNTQIKQGSIYLKND